LKPATQIDVYQLVTESFRTAQAEYVTVLPGGRGNGVRSRNFIKQMHKQFADAYSVQKDVVVLSRPVDNHKLFLLNELLHDVCVFEKGAISALRTRRLLPYVSAPLWQVESEFNRRLRQVLLDFSKLTLGSAPNKLMVIQNFEYGIHGPHAITNAEVRRWLVPIAASCQASVSHEYKVFLAIIPHPNQWNQASPKEVSAWVLETERWVPLRSSFNGQ